MRTWLTRRRWWILATAFAVALGAAGLLVVESDSKRRNEAFAAIRIGMQKDEVDRLLAYARAKKTSRAAGWRSNGSPEYAYYERWRQWVFIQWSKECVVKNVWRDTDPPIWEAWLKRVRIAVGL
jgi:hypothetical protein